MGYPKDMKDRQDEFGEWADKCFPKSTPESILAHFAREAVELVGIEVMERALEHEKKKAFGRPVTFDGQASECADCTLLLFHYAHKKDFSLQNACRDKFYALQERTWGGTGLGRCS